MRAEQLYVLYDPAGGGPIAVADREERLNEELASEKYTREQQLRFEIATDVPFLT